MKTLLTLLLLIPSLSCGGPIAEKNPGDVSVIITEKNTMPNPLMPKKSITIRMTLISLD
jgi:hypothetical protein